MAARDDQTGAVIAPGTTVAGKYRIKRVVGQGGMGTVYLAHHEALDHAVAIKIFSGVGLDGASRSQSGEGIDGEDQARFMREARAAAKLQSAHVARVFDVGTVDSRRPYIVMEHLDGIDLHRLVHSRGPLRVVDAVDYVLQAIDAVAEAHSLGIVHRDLKPANLFLCSRSDGTTTIKVLDFGIAKIDDGLTSHLTSTSVLLGSPSYMSPEQFRSARDADARSDQWSLGVTLYEILTKELPFQGATLGALCAALYQTPPRTPRMIRGDIPEPLEKVIMRCLSLDPAHRFASVADLARALAPHGSGRAAAAVERAAVMLEQEPPASETKPLVIASMAAPTRIEPLTPDLSVPAPATQAGWGTAADPGAAARRRSSVALPLTLAVIAAGALGGALLYTRAPRSLATTATAPGPSAMTDGAAKSEASAQPTAARVEASSSQTASAVASVIPSASAPPSTVSRPRAVTSGPRPTASQRPLPPAQNLNLEDRH